MEMKGEKDPQSINLLMPFSLREIPQKIEDLKFENDFSTLCFTLALRNKFNESFSAIKAVTSKMKNSVNPFGFNTMTQMIGTLPGIFGQLVLMWVVSKATIVLSNVPGPKTPLQFGSCKCKGFIGLIPGLGDLAFGISAISQADTIYMAVQADLCYLEDPRELRDLIEKNYDELIKNADYSSRKV